MLSILLRFRKDQSCRVGIVGTTQLHHRTSEKDQATAIVFVTRSNSICNVRVLACPTSQSHLVTCSSWISTSCVYTIAQWMHTGLKGRVQRNHDRDLGSGATQAMCQLLRSLACAVPQITKCQASFNHEGILSESKCMKRDSRCKPALSMLDPSEQWCIKPLLGGLLYTCGAVLLRPVLYLSLVTYFAHNVLSTCQTDPHSELHMEFLDHETFIVYRKLFVALTLQGRWLLKAQHVHGSENSSLTTFHKALHHCYKHGVHINEGLVNDSKSSQHLRASQQLR